MEEPMYIKIEDHEKLTKNISEIKEKADEVRQKLSELKDIKRKEEESIQDWEKRTEHLLKTLDVLSKGLSGR